MSAVKCNAMIFAVHRTVNWWRYIGKNMGGGTNLVLTDLRGQGDISIVNDFYQEIRRQNEKIGPLYFSEEEMQEIVIRCRTLRWLDPILARKMINAMAISFNRVLDKYEPRFILSFPVDRYVKDVLRRVAFERDIPHFEVTTGIIPGTSMLLRQGMLLNLPELPPVELIEREVKRILDPQFLPSYVPRKLNNTKAKFLYTRSYFQLRAIGLKLKSWLSLDPLNIHYLDAQMDLGHKCKYKDSRIVGLYDLDWPHKLLTFPLHRRIFFGLQLYPEASIDYWIRNTTLLEYEKIIVEAAQAFSNHGFMILLKDHPLQFGFRQTELIDRLKAIPNVVFVPCNVPGKALLKFVGSQFTFTGTLGFESALFGLKSVVAQSYYSNEEDFVIFKNQLDIQKLPERVLATPILSDFALKDRQRRIIGELLRGCFRGEMMTFKDFEISNPNTQALDFSQSLGQHIHKLTN